MGILDWIASFFYTPPPPSHPRSRSHPSPASNPPPPSPEYGKPWRSMNWRDRQNLLTKVTNFQPENKEVNTLRILLHGPVGAGKSSFFNSVNSALQGRITTRALAHSVATGCSFTLECKTYKVKKDRADSFFPFTFTDIAGMHDVGTGIQSEDIIQLLNGCVSDGYTCGSKPELIVHKSVTNFTPEMLVYEQCKRVSCMQCSLLSGQLQFNPASPITKDDTKYKRNPTLKDRIHCLVAVLPADTVSMMDDGKIKQMRVVRKKARNLGIPQVIIMTKVDEACPLVKEDLKKIYKSKQIKQKMEECSIRLGVPVNCIYPVKNYHEERTTNTTTDILILDALQNIVNFSNDYVEDQVDNE